MQKHTNPKTFYIAEEEQEAVGDIHLAHASIGIDEEQIHIGVVATNGILNSFGHNMISDSVERLGKTIMIYYSIELSDAVQRMSDDVMLSNS